MACKQRQCPECGLPVERKSKRGPVPVFCCTKHKTDFNNRQTVRGRVLISYAMAWRQQRGKAGTGSDSFQEMCTILDGFNAEDRKAGRPLVTHYVENSLLADGRRYMDRRDWRKERDTKEQGKSMAVIEAKAVAALSE